jgi:hypothetical protein
VKTLLPLLRAELRQRRQHRAFRIAPPEPDEALFAELDRLVAELSALAEPTGAAESTPTGSGPVLDEKALAEAATSLWQAQRKLAQDGQAASRYARQARRYLGLCQEALTDVGLVVQDHDGDVFHPGRSLEILAFEDDPGSDTERVLHTVRPSLYFRDRHIQIGQVIVGRPGRAAEEGDSHA